MAVIVTIEFNIKPSADHSLKNGELKSETVTELSPSEELPSKPQQSSWRRRLEIFLLTCAILAICAPFVIPTILYALPPLGPTMSERTQNDTQTVNQCEDWKSYAGDICFQELTELQSCYIASHSSMARVPLDTNQEEAEAAAKRFLQGLPLLSPSPECEAAIRPFLCLYLFGSCDTDNQQQQATQADCERMRDNVCAQEWAVAERYLGQGVLPDCSTLNNQEDECQGLNNSKKLIEQNKDSTNITCADGYYLSESGVCRPLCSLWTEPMNIDSDYVAIILVVVVGLLSATFLIVLALTIQRKTILTFPTYYLVYLCMTAIGLGVLLLIGLVSRGKWFCSSDDLLQTFIDETIYCTFSGIIFTYGLAQIGLWVFFHCLGLFWCVIFPLHLRKFKAEEKLKYIHITTVFIALFLPLVPALLHLTRGYSIANTPTTVCLGRSIVVTFYSFVLPLNIISAVATSILMVMFWTIFKKLVLKKSSKTVQRNGASQSIMKKAEAKILFIMCYYILLGTLVLTLFTHLEESSDNPEVVQALEWHFACQSTGLQPGKDCGKPPHELLSTFSALSAVSTILSGLLPVVVMAFTLKCTCTCRSKEEKQQSH